MSTFQGCMAFRGVSLTYILYYTCSTFRMHVCVCVCVCVTHCVSFHMLCCTIIEFMCSAALLVLISDAHHCCTSYNSSESSCIVRLPAAAFSLSPDSIGPPSCVTRLPTALTLYYNKVVCGRMIFFIRAETTRSSSC